MLNSKTVYTLHTQSLCVSLIVCVKHNEFCQSFRMPVKMGIWNSARYKIHRQMMCVFVCVSVQESTCQNIPQKWMKWNFDDGTGKIRSKWKMCPSSRMNMTFSRYDRASTSHHITSDPILTRATASATFKWRLHRNLMKYERYFVYIVLCVYWCWYDDIYVYICLSVYISGKPLKSQQWTYSYLYISFSTF